MKRLLFSLLLLAVSWQVMSQAPVNDGKVIISGKIKDASNGEELFGATVFIKEKSTGSSSNSYGFYSIKLEPGVYSFKFSFIGFLPEERTIDLTKSQTLDIELKPNNKLLSEVTVQGEKTNANITRIEMSAEKMEMKDIRKIPALLGEVDVIKAIQLLPGVQMTAEGTSGFSVRGGSSDQNLILLDEATVYNVSHLMGFFSVFNNDAVNEVKLYKGDIPVSSGGRLSSLLDVRMKNGNNKKFTGTGGIGLISSRLTLEGPILKDRTSFLVSGRRTYVDLFLPLAKTEEVRKSSLYFYDLNLKVNHQFNENNRLFLSGYFGNDVFKNKFAEFGFGNRTFTARWNHLFSKSLFSNVTLIYTNYNYYLGTPEGNANSFIWKSDLTDYGAKIDFNLFANTNHTIKFGVSTTYHNFKPGSAKGKGEEGVMDYSVPNNYAIESGAYISNEHKIGEKLTLKYGIRFSMFNNIGSATIFKFNSDYVRTDSTVYKKGNIFNTYTGWDPRAGLAYVLSPKTSLKASYSHTVQYLHLASNSTGGTPLDIWFPSSPNIKPQKADQFAAGIFRNFLNNTIETSVELYYKKMSDIIDFKDHADLLLNKELEGEIRPGKAEAYGAEFYVKVNYGKINGWVSYTYSKAKRTITAINNGKTYDAPYDRPNNISAVFNYQLTDRMTVSANWVFSTAAPWTVPTGRMEVENNIVPIYSDRNAFRFENYHRLDLSLTIVNKVKPSRKWTGEWVFSVYNAYNRKNTWALGFVQDAKDPNVTYAEKTYLFPIIPTVTYNFKF
jgi:hypothetical protein